MFYISEEPWDFLLQTDKLQIRDVVQSYCDWIREIYMFQKDSIKE